jgi:hypothetical protein
MEFILANWKDILLVLTSIVTVASAYVKTTEGTRDDEVVGLISKILKILAMTPKDK